MSLRQSRDFLPPPKIVKGVRDSAGSRSLSRFRGEDGWSRAVVI